MGACVNVRRPVVIDNSKQCLKKLAARTMKSC